MINTKILISEILKGLNEKSVRVQVDGGFQAIYYFQNFNTNLIESKDEGLKIFLGEKGGQEVCCIKEMDIADYWKEQDGIVRIMLENEQIVTFEEV